MRGADVAAERAAIDTQVNGQTLCTILERNAGVHGDLPALAWKQDGGWRQLNWRQYRERVAEVAMGLDALGVGRGDFVAIMSRNRPEHLIADLAAVHLGATPVSLYNTLAPEYVPYLPLAHSLERLSGHYVGLWKPSCVYFCADLNSIIQILPEVRPFSFVTVPRL